MASPRSPSNDGICSRSVVKFLVELEFIPKDTGLIIIQDVPKKNSPGSSQSCFFSLLLRLALYYLISQGIKVSFFQRQFPGPLVIVGRVNSKRQRADEVTAIGICFTNNGIIPSFHIKPVESFTP